jgi:hypothetical protein
MELVTLLRIKCPWYFADANGEQIVEIVLGVEQGDFVGEGHIFAMIRLIGHWQADGRIEKSMIFVQGTLFFYT